MANNEFKELGTEDLQYELESAKAKYQKLKFDHTTLGLENPQVLVEVRRDIARIKTELRSREIVAMNAEELANRSKIRNRRREERGVK
ncbi:MAG: 50S ribosomal protein L29 [Saprospiraceae bacterium]